jgi:hypothetical protein
MTMISLCDFLHTGQNANDKNVNGPIEWTTERGDPLLKQRYNTIPWEYLL